MSSPPKSSNTADVIIIGGGLIGCTIALRLAEAGLSVCVLERGEPGCEASSAAGGMLAPQGETREPGPLFALCAASRDMYSAFVAEVSGLSGIEVDYRRDGTLLVATSDHEQQGLEAVHRAQTRMGLSIARLTREAIHTRVPGLSTRIQYGLFVPGDHWLDNEKLCAAVAAACKRVGVRMLARHSVTQLRAENGRVADVEVVSESGARETLSADHFVLTAGCWSAALVEPLGISLPMKPCRGQMMEFESPRGFPLTVRAGHHYLVPRPNGRVVVGTTSEYVGFEKAVTVEGIRSILAGALRIAPVIRQFKFLRAWSGLRPDTADHLPILGYGEIPNLVFATGHFRNGILLAPITAEIIADLIVKGSTSRSIEPYRPTRFRS